MNGRDMEGRSMLRYSLAFLAVKLAACVGLGLYALIFKDNEPQNLSTPITIAAVGLAVLWFAKATKRPMSRSELVRFSFGNVLADAGLSIAWAFGMMLLLRVPLNWSGLAVVLGGQGDGHNAQMTAAVGLVIGGISVFAQSALFAWLLLRKLPRPSSSFD